MTSSLKIQYLEVHNFTYEELREYTAKIRAERISPVARKKAVRKKKGDTGSGQLEAVNVPGVSEEVSAEPCEEPEAN